MASISSSDSIPAKQASGATAAATPLGFVAAGTPIADA